MPVGVARQKKSLFAHHLRSLHSPRKRITKTLWLILALLILYMTFGNLHEAHVAEAPEPPEAPDIFEGYSTHDQRVAWLREVQARQKGPPPVVRLTIYAVCPSGCHALHSSSILTGNPSMDLKHIVMDAKTVRLDEPPIPIIGTDEEHRRLVSARDVADFMTHVTVWRGVFHGDGGVGVFLSCRVKDPLPVLRALRKDVGFRNETEGGSMGRDSWDVLLLGAGRELAVPRGPVHARAVSQEVIGEDDLLGYAVSQRGANRLLSYARAYTVPIKSFVSVVLGKDAEILRWDGAGLGQVEACEIDKGETRDSTTLPFYPPVHWIHDAARKRR